MNGSAPAVVMASQASMLCVCTSAGCTTIVFGPGTCVQHDDRHPVQADRSLTGAAGREQREKAATARSPVTS